MKDKNLSFKNFRPFRKIITQTAMRFRLDDFFTDCYQDALKAKKNTWGDNFELQAQFHEGMTLQFLVDKITQNQTIGKILRRLDQISHGKLKLYTSGFYDFDKDIPQRLTAGSFIHPQTGETVNKSIKDLEKDALVCSIKFIRAADDYIKSGNKEAFLAAVPNIHFDTGTVNSKLSDIRKRVTDRDLASIIGESKDTPTTKHHNSSFNLLSAILHIANQHK